MKHVYLMIQRFRGLQYDFCRLLFPVFEGVQANLLAICQLQKSGPWRIVQKPHQIFQFNQTFSSNIHCIEESPDQWQGPHLISGIHRLYDSQRRLPCRKWFWHPCIYMHLLYSEVYPRHRKIVPATSHSKLQDICKPQCNEVCFPLQQGGWDENSSNPPAKTSRRMFYRACILIFFESLTCRYLQQFLSVRICVFLVYVLNSMGIF